MCENKIKSVCEQIPENNVNVETGNKDVGIKKKDVPMNFEEALTLTKFGKFNIFLIIIAGLVLTNVLLETLGISFVHPVAQCDLKLTTQDKGLLSAIGFVGIISSSYLWGFLADTQGRKKVIQPTLFLGFLMSVISSFLTNFWAFLIVRFLNGFFISGGSATIYPYLGEFHTNKTRSRSIMGASVIFGIGCMLLPAIAWLVINQTWSFYIPILDITYKPWRLFIIVCGIPGLFCAFSLCKIPESPRFELAQNRQKEAVKILRTIYSINTKKSEDEFPVNSIVDDFEDVSTRKQLIEISNPILSLLRSMWNQTAPLFQKNYLKKTLIACTLQFGIFATSNGMYMWFPDILNQISEYTSNNNDTQITICEAVYRNQAKLTLDKEIQPSECIDTLDISTYEHSLVLEMLYAVGFAFIGLVINKVGKLSILFITLVGCGTCGVAAAYVNIPLMAIYFYLILLLCGLGVTVVNAATVDLFPTNLRAMAVCISLMMGRLGSVVGANIVGVLLDNYCTSAFLMSSFSLIFCGVLALFIPKPSGKLNLQRRVSLTSMTGN